MFATEFIYDDVSCRDFGLYICKFDSSSSVENINIGSQITFNLSSVPGSNKEVVYGSSYQETITAVFQVIKLSGRCGIAEEISCDELSKIMRWLNRKDGFHKFKLLQNDYENLYTEASFNVQKIEINGKVYGLEITMTSLYPYLLEEQGEVCLDFLEADSSILIYDTSDEVGHIYPDMKIICNGNGNLAIQNTMEHRTMRFCNCTRNEIITIDGQNKIITTSLPSHKIQNDFNYVFFRIANTYQNRENIVSSSIPCTLKLNWSPIRKVGF